MSPRCLRLALAGATVAAGIAVSPPASAAVTYDPATKTGFVGRADVQNAFGWTDAVLAERAAELEFDHGFWIDDIYSAACGASTVAMVHHREYGNFDLVDTLAHREERGAPGYGGKLTGFRLTGAISGISGTSVPPAAGEPCPEAGNATIDQISLVSSTTGWTLAVSFGDLRRELVAELAPTP